MPELDNFFLLEFDDFKNRLISAGFEKYRAKQVFDAVYKNFIFDPNQIPAIPQKLKDWLSQNLEFSAAKLVGGKESDDDAKKYLFELKDGNFVECVLLKAPSQEGGIRKTLCMSTQVGCACACKFCASALRGFVRNLSAAEILSQALPFVKETIQGTKKSRSFEFENIVVMGMGEPLINYENLSQALKVFNQADKFEFGSRRITVSTCGIADKLEQLADDDFPYRLAISLHGATNQVRSQIMPINNRFPLERLLEAAEKFAGSSGRMITLEYILINNVNDTFEQARELVKIAQRLHAHVNLIPYNTVESLPWKRSDSGRRAAFANILKNAGVSYTLRREKGSGIDAACGQLALKKSREDSGKTAL